jgi:hypothetical protein
MTMTVALDFDQWRIIVQGPDVIIDGGRQPEKVSAKEQARRIAERYLREQKHETLPTVHEVVWTAINPNSCLKWRP